MKVLFALIFCCCVVVVSSAQHPAVRRFIQEPALRHAAVGISVKALTDGKVVAEYNPQTALHPASITKLITTVSALKSKGAEYRFRTSVAYTGEISDHILYGDIIIRAAGDPTPDSKYFPSYKLTDQLVKKIIATGIKKIEGRILVLNDPAVDIPGSWPWEDISNYYGAVCHGFNYRDNTYWLDFRSGKAGSSTELIGITPRLPGVNFVNEVKASAQNKDDAWIFGGPYANKIHIKGTIPQNQASYRVKGAMHDPAVCFVEELTGLLHKNGVTVVGKETGDKPVERPFMTFESPALKEIVYHTNKSSVNLFAEALGTQVADVDRQFEAMGIDASGVILKDACGLSHLNAVPADVFTDLLIWADKNIGESFLVSLPVAGVDGGLRGYCGDSPLLKNKVKAKTGSFAGVRCLSGFLQTSAGTRLAFTIMVNNYTADTSALYKAIRTFLEELSR